ncbi:MAG: alanine--tRNA ligase [Candidatus Magasanikbacteria bacterium]|jgi:alanyl-tRNA synthetase|nr:alanine--tRNA ligase [Candidatus Magasanikbacteria bacterium]MBT4314929.1 alanine--tRNA ligase [Candidatus Magasanikbacteria bacterium]MBT4546885.1 alanine--tRNA ligase [Candidatus Magasanikbacteria bacterium]MBT6819201.1 alanine--tRNA ligase [Candidatus Magasanikbacteria bacterium]
MKTNDLRQKYLEFFESKKHTVISSASLIPENDPTTLFTGSGMQPMVPYLLGEKHPQGVRIADSQKCFRAVDMEEVGDNRHTTFFEMLGNWSLGDYFKVEEIEWMFEFLTKEIGLDPDKIYITCFRGDEKNNIPRDEEGAQKWQQLFESNNVNASIADMAEEKGMQDARIFYYDATKNWWSRAGVPGNMPVGEPGGPDSEMFWDFGEESSLHEKSEWKDKVCHVNCDCGRFMEIGNNVFMQYIKKEGGFEELKQKNIDFGGGLERMAAALLDSPDIFNIDLFTKAKEKLEELSGKKYGENEKETFAFRVILDHLRAATFLIADGAVPSNKDQGYFTRRLIRRAVRFADNLGINDLFTASIAKSYIETYGNVGGYLENKEDLIFGEMKKEEEKFRTTLEQGIKEFEKLLNGFRIAEEKTGKKIIEISGKQAFKLYDTYGFPVELTEDLAKENNMVVYMKGFEEAFQKHQDLSRAGAEQKFKGGLADSGEMSTKYHTATHLLHSALRNVLGEHVEQKGSNITADRLRFDFTHGEKMTDEQKKQVEDLVNDSIDKKLSVSMEEMSVEEAKDKDAIGLFGDKYGEKVKVYTIGSGDDIASKEICGGPHVEDLGNMGHFRIKKEESSSSGVRRIKAILE